MGTQVVAARHMNAGARGMGLGDHLGIIQVLSTHGDPGSAC